MSVFKILFELSWIKLLLCILYHCGIFPVNCDVHEVRLVKSLLSEYNPSVRPVENFTGPLLITFNLSLHHIIDVDEKNQILTTNCWLTQTWTDHHLKWNYSDFGGIKVIRIPFDRIWKPDLILYNNADTQYSSSVINTNVIISHDGEVTWLSHGIYKSSCDINVEYFPFDIQHCILKWASWTYDGYQLDLQIPEPKGDLSNYHENGEFDLLSFQATRNEVQYSCCPDEPYPDITFTITLKRRHFFYVFNLIIPCCLINGIALLVFFVPPDSGEKVTLGISALLSMTVFLMTIRESLPPTEKTPLIGIYYGVSICIVTSASAMSVITLNIHHRGLRSIPVPRLVRLLTHFLSKILLIQSDPNFESVAREKEINLEKLKELKAKLGRFHPALRQELDASGAFRKCDYLDNIRMSPPRNLDYRMGKPSVFTLGENKELDGGDVEKRFIETIEKVFKCIEKYEYRMQNQFQHETLELEWKTVAYVCDRVLFWIFTVSTVISTVLILSSSPYGP